MPNGAVWHAPDKPSLGFLNGLYGPALAGAKSSGFSGIAVKIV